jgi:hypothetical protein
MNKQLDVLMHKEMTRKEFLTTLGVGLVTLLGFSSLLRLLTGKQHHVLGGGNATTGYGSSAYGGGQN